MKREKNKAPSISDQKRKAIIAAAETCFLQQGFQGCSMDKIARDAHVAKQTVYAHFDSKENLFQEVMHALCEESSACPFSAQEPGTIPEQAFFAEVTFAILNFMCQPKVLALYRIVVSEAPQQPQLAEKFMACGPRYITEMVEDYLKQRRKVAGLKIKNPRAIAWAIYSLIQGEKFMSYVFGLAKPTPKDIKKAAADIVQTILLILDKGRP